MKIKFLPFVALLSALFLMTSCFGDDDELVLDDNTAITAFSVNQGKQYIHTKAKDGSDSVYVKDVTLTTYKFYIDQLKGEIYNTDSLPAGVDASKLLCTISSSYTGALVIQSMTSDSLEYYNSADSTDFTKPRIIYMYSNSAKYRRKYIITVNVHREQPDSMAWTAMPANETLSRMTAAKAVACGRQLFVFGNIDGTTQAVSTTDGKNWHRATFNFDHTLAADAYESVVVKGDYLYIADGETIMRSQDANTWETCAQQTGIKRLVAASRYRLFGYSTDGRLMASTDNGATWNAAVIDEAQTLLPTAEVSGLCLTLPANTDADRVILMGKAQNEVAIWGKVDEDPTNSEDQTWTYYDISPDNTHLLPTLSGMKAFAYDGAAYVFGVQDGILKSYRSDDGCITWNADTVIAPAANTNIDAAHYAVTVGADSYIWLVNLNNGTTWRGRLNRLGWAEEKKTYTWK